jgi:hypothetical protein
MHTEPALPEDKELSSELLLLSSDLGVLCFGLEVSSKKVGILSSEAEGWCSNQK